MAVEAVQGEPLHALLQCSVCINVFTDPRTLPCLHTYCFKCIADWCKDTQPGGKVTCPECRKEFVIPDSGIDGLKKNFFVANLLSINEVKHKTGDLCEICIGDDKKVSQVFCLQCEQSYCESCSKAHLKMKICSSHELVRLEKFQSDVDNSTVVLDVLRSGANNKKKYRPQYCDKHTDKLVELYCLDDEVAICMMCCVLDHRSHRCEETKNIANQFRTGKWKQDLQTALSEVEEKFGVLNSRKLKFLDHMRSVENEICEEADKKIQLIKDHKQKLVYELEKLKATNERELDRVNQKLTQAKELLTVFMEHCDKLLTEGSDVDICREKKYLCRRTEELINTKDLEHAVDKLDVSNVTFLPSTVIFEDQESILGGLAAGAPGALSESEEKPISTVTSPVADKNILRLRRLGQSRRHGIKSRGNMQLLLTAKQPPTDSDGDP